jgi:hypothetical protein
VSRDTLTVGIEIIRRLIAGANRPELDLLLADMRETARREGRQSDFETFDEQARLLLRDRDAGAVNERGLSVLIETAHDLSKTLEQGDLLRTIVARARSLVAAHLAWVAVLDEQNGMFRTVAAEGHLSSATAAMTSQLDVGAVGLIMKSRSFFDTQNYLGDTRFRHSHELDRVFEKESIVSLAGFPILTDGEVNGFLFVADRFARKLSGREISVLGSFALHAGVAIRNSNLFSRLSGALSEAEHNRNALIDHIKRVEASATAHDEMTTLLANGAELPQFLQRLSAQISGAVMLYDADMRIRDEHASSEYSGRMADDLRSGAIDSSTLIAASALSRHTGRSVVVLRRDDEECRVIALHGGPGRAETLVLCHRHSLDAIDIRNVERSAVALTIAKLWNEKRETDRQISSSTLVRQLVLLSPPDPTTLSAVTDRLHLRVGQPIVLCLVAISNLDRAAQTTIVWEAAADSNLLIDFLDDTHVVAGTEDVVRTFIRELLSRRNGWDAGGIVSEPIANLGAAAAHFAQLGRSLRALRKMEPIRHFIEYGDAGLFARIIESQDSERLVRDVTVPLRALDKLSPRQRTEAKKTLLTYFDCRHNLTRTATELGLHINTVRQRLNKLREITGNWGDPVRALELHFSLRLEAVVKAPAHLPVAGEAENARPVRRRPGHKGTASSDRA